MLRFKLGPIPVEVHPGHFLMAAALGMPPRLGPNGASELIGQLLPWIAIVFVSVLFHELGHALVALRFGYRPQIELLWSGGLTHPNATAPIPWLKDIALTLAGPVFGLILGGVAFLAATWLQPPGTMGELLSTLISVNLYWSIFNLLPVLPMDGGRIVGTALTRFFGRRGFLMSQLLALVLAGSLALLFATILRNTYGAAILGLFALRAGGQIAAYFRGRRPEGGGPDSVPLARARELYQQGKLDEARASAEQILDSEAGAQVRSKAHHLLGWLAIKEGQGRRALDHFSQVQGQPVEPQALGAAFSLLGDELRAIPFWELAFRESRDPTVLHEWAGSLIRADRVEEARKLPGVDPAAAYACAERVFFIRGNFSEAARVGLAALEQYPSAEAAYNTACALARSGDRERAVGVLEHAAELGFHDEGLAESDSDLALLHGMERFEAWLDKLRKIQVH